MQLKFCGENRNLKEKSIKRGFKELNCQKWLCANVKANSIDKQETI